MVPPPPPPPSQLGQTRLRKEVEDEGNTRFSSLSRPAHAPVQVDPAQLRRDVSPKGLDRPSSGPEKRPGDLPARGFGSSLPGNFRPPQRCFPNGAHLCLPDGRPASTSTQKTVARASSLAVARVSHPSATLPCVAVAPSQDDPSRRLMKKTTFQVGKPDADGGARRSSRFQPPISCGRCLARRRRARRRKESRRPQLRPAVSLLSPVEVSRPPEVGQCQPTEEGTRGWSASEERVEQGTDVRIDGCSEEVLEAGRDVRGSELEDRGPSRGNSDLGVENEENALLPFALLSEDLFQHTPVSRLPDEASEGAVRLEEKADKVLALPAPPPVSGDLLAAMEIVEEAYQGEELGPSSSGRLSKGEVMDMLTEVENFMGSQAIETARLIGVADDGVDKGLKASMLLIKRRWLAGSARKAKSDLAGSKDL